MKIFFISLFTFIVCLFLLIQFVAIPKAKTNIENILTNFGLQNIDINDVQFNLGGLTIPQVTLDNDGFNRIENMNVTLFWPTYLVKPEITKIYFDTIKISSTTQEIIDSLDKIKRRIMMIDTQQTINIVSAPKIIWDISTKFGAIRINAALDFKNGDDLKLDIKAAQNQLAFNSQWEAKIIDKNNIDAQGTFTDMKLNMPPFTLNRADGWASYDIKNGFSGQLNAGSGTFLTLPLQSVSIAASAKENYYPVIIRSQITGNPTSNIYADLNISNNIDAQDFNFRFESTQFEMLLDYLLQRKLISPQLAEQSNLERFLFIANFLKDRRFVDGPWPFSIMVSDQVYKDVNGVFLFYPNTQMMRGSVQGNEDIISFLKLFLSKDQDTSDNIIRFDDDLKQYLIQ